MLGNTCTVRERATVCGSRGCVAICVWISQDQSPPHRGPWWGKIDGIAEIADDHGGSPWRPLFLGDMVRSCFTKVHLHRRPARSGAQALGARFLLDSWVAYKASSLFGLIFTAFLIDEFAFQSFCSADEWVQILESISKFQLRASLNELVWTEWLDLSVAALEFSDDVH